MSRRRKVSNN